MAGGRVNVILSVGVDVLPPDSEGVGLLVLELNGEEFVERTVVASGVLDIMLLPSLKYLTLSLALLLFTTVYDVVIVCLFVVVESLCVGERGLIVIVVTCDFNGEFRFMERSGSLFDSESQGRDLSEEGEVLISEASELLIGDFRISLRSEMPEELVSETVEATEGLRSLLMSEIGFVGVVGWELNCCLLYRFTIGLSDGF